MENELNDNMEMSENEIKEMILFYIVSFIKSNRNKTIEIKKIK